MLGYLALKFETHQHFSQRTSFIDSEEEVNMNEDSPNREMKAEEKVELKDFKDEKESPIYRACFQAVEHAAEVLKSEEQVSVAETQYQQVAQRLGLLKMRALEFLQKITATFSQDLLLEFVD